MSIRFYEPAAKFVPALSPDTAKIVSFMVIFIACIIAALMAGWIAGRVVKEAGIGWLNRIAGGALGFLKGFLIVAVVVMLLITFLPNDNALIKNSKAVPYVVSGIEVMGSFVPDDLWGRYKAKIEALQSGAIRKVMKRGSGESENKKEVRGKSDK